MKVIIFLVFNYLIFVIAACDDKNTNDGPISSDTIINKTYYEAVSFNFLNAGVFIKCNDSTPSWVAITPSVWSKPFVLVNYSNTKTIQIKSAKTKNTIFQLFSDYTMPYNLKYRDTNIKNEIFIQIDTRKYPPGDYKDWIYFNDDIKLGFLAKVTIK